MYGLPRSTSLDFFVGKTLLQACFGVHDLILNFDENISVTISSSVGCMGACISIRQSDNFSQVAPAVFAMLHKSVLSAEGDSSGTLTLRFDGGGVLFIYDDSMDYESYTIKNGEQLIVV
jgi:hypothetical protein